MAATKNVQPLNPYIIGSNAKLNNNPYVYAVNVAKSEIKRFEVNRLNFDRKKYWT